MSELNFTDEDQKIYANFLRELNILGNVEAHILSNALSMIHAILQAAPTKGEEISDFVAWFTKLSYNKRVFILGRLSNYLILNKMEQVIAAGYIDANDNGFTNLSLEFYQKHRKTLGKLLSVRGKQGIAPDFYLEFENGTVRFTGLNCGYFGEGPRGLATILYEEGFFKTLQEAREYVASHQTIDLNRQVVGVR